MDSMASTPERMTITDLSTAETIEMQYNPEELNESIASAYGRQNPQGLSHTVKQFANTEDLGLDFKLYLTSNGLGPEDHARMLDVRNFLHSLHYPRGRATTIREGGPPRILFVWPGIYSLTCVAIRTKINHSKFNLGGQPVIMTAEINIEEIRDGFISSEDVRKLGTRRSPAAGGR
jgi:hypothetical protein